MPIPALNAAGFLPPGIYDTDLLEVRAGFDVIIAERDSHLYKTYIEFFSRVREVPGAAKGLLRLPL